MRPLCIVDTSVLVAGLLTGRADSPTAQVVDWMLDGSLPFLLSPDLLAEYRQVLLRPAIASRHGLSVDEVDELLTTVVANALWREPPPAPAAAPDPGDDHLWALLALEPKAVLVTGDAALLQGAPAGSRVVPPGEFIDH